MPFPEMVSLYGFQEEEDSQYFKQTTTDPTIRIETDGGYVITRPRYTRRPRRIITTGFTFISETGKSMLEAYYALKRGGAEAFPYVHPTSGETLTVRFKAPVEFDYDGVGQLRVWNAVKVELEEV